MASSSALPVYRSDDHLFAGVFTGDKHRPKLGDDLQGGTRVTLTRAHGSADREAGAANHQRVSRHGGVRVGGRRAQWCAAVQIAAGQVLKFVG